MLWEGFAKSVAPSFISTFLDDAPKIGVLVVLAFPLGNWAFSKDFPKELPKEFPKELPKDFPKVFPKTLLKDFPKEIRKKSEKKPKES